MDAIVFRDLRVEALVGIHRRERHVLQTVSIDLEIGVPGAAVFVNNEVMPDNNAAPEPEDS